MEPPRKKRRVSKKVSYAKYFDGEISSNDDEICSNDEYIPGNENPQDENYYPVRETFFKVVGKTWIQRIFELYSTTPTKTKSDMILEITSERLRKHLVERLQKVKKKDLKEILYQKYSKRFIGEKTGTTRPELIVNVIGVLRSTDYLFGVHKRNIEKTNIDELIVNSSHVCLCDIDVPFDVFLIILSYLDPYGHVKPDQHNRIGETRFLKTSLKMCTRFVFHSTTVLDMCCVNPTFYYGILLQFTRVMISKYNVYRIPLVVLRNVKYVIIKHKLTRNKLKYIHENISESVEVISCLENFFGDNKVTYPKVTKIFRFPSTKLSPRTNWKHSKKSKEFFYLERCKLPNLTHLMYNDVSLQNLTFWKVSTLNTVMVNFIDLCLYGLHFCQGFKNIEIYDVNIGTPFIHEQFLLMNFDKILGHFDNIKIFGKTGIFIPFQFFNEISRCVLKFGFARNLHVVYWCKDEFKSKHHGPWIAALLKPHTMEKLTFEVQYNYDNLIKEEKGKKMYGKVLQKLGGYNVLLRYLKKKLSITPDQIKRFGNYYKSIVFEFTRDF